MEVWNSKKYNEGCFPIDEAARLHSTVYFNYLIDTFEGKLNGSLAYKYIHLSAHGGTVTGFMAGIETWLDFGPEFASFITVELFK